MVTKGPPGKDAHGYDVTILIDLCKVVIRLESEGKLLENRHAEVIQQAHVIVNASAKLGIKNLVYALTGYDATCAEIIAAFKDYVRKEAREYEKEFPPELYAEWYRLYELPKMKRGNRPWKFRHLTIEHVYHPLAKSKGKIFELAKEKRALSDEQNVKIHQFLSETGVKALRTHLGQLLGIAQVSDDRGMYERHVEKVFGKQTRFEGEGF